MSDDDKVFVHVDPSEVEPQALAPRDDGKCQYCGGETEIGYGLAGGGIGPYTYCMRCGRICDKWPDPT
jgi:hypothetical protein